MSFCATSGPRLRRDQIVDSSAVLEEIGEAVEVLGVGDHRHLNPQGDQQAGAGVLGNREPGWHN
jgi:hypothetical protein